MRKNRSASVLSIFCALALSAFVLSSHASAQDPRGVWKGEWRSQSTGHRGPMRAKIQSDGRGGYDARFTGRFALIVPFTYRTKLQPYYDANGNLGLSANQSLGPILGSYSMQTTVGASDLRGSFQAAADTGSVQMRRIR